MEKEAQEMKNKDEAGNVKLNGKIKSAATGRK